VFLVVAIAASLAASLSFAVSAILEQRATKQVPDRGVFAPRLLVDLARQPLWMASIGATIVGLGLQIVALHAGPLALVQPILVCDLVFAVLLAAALRGASPDRTIFAGVVCCAVGIGVFLAVAQPTGGTETVSLPAVIPLAAGLAGVLAGCLIWAKRGPRVARPLALALACGVCYGVSAFLLKLVSFSLDQGFSEPLRQWPLNAVAIVGPVGFLLNQEAFQSGTLISPVLAVITNRRSAGVDRNRAPLAERELRQRAGGRSRPGGGAGRDDHRCHLARPPGADRGSLASRDGRGRGCDREPMDHVAADAERPSRGDQAR